MMDEHDLSVVSRRTLLVGALAAAQSASALTVDAAPGKPVVELRQYKIVRGRRDEFVALFEREFVDTQEQLPIRLVGEFRDLDDPDRFTWIREFPNFETRAATLNAFYTGPAWRAHRAEANAMLDDNDNVLLLRPSGAGSGFGQRRRDGSLRSAPRPGMVVATIHYLWKDPRGEFATFFDGSGRVALQRAGVEVLGSFVPEDRPNDFPKLPVRQGEKAFVWFTRVPDALTYERAMADFRGSAGRRRGACRLMPDLEERCAQVLRLGSTPRSRL